MSEQEFKECQTVYFWDRFDRGVPILCFGDIINIIPPGEDVDVYRYDIECGWRLRYTEELSSSPEEAFDKLIRLGVDYADGKFSPMLATYTNLTRLMDRAISACDLWEMMKGGNPDRFYSSFCKDMDSLVTVCNRLEDEK